MIKVSFNYRLQPLLELKIQARKKAEKALARALVRQEEEKKKMKKLEEEKKEIIQRRREVRRKLHEKVSSGNSRVQDGSSRIAFLKRLEEDEKAKDKEIEDQKKVLEECEQQVKRARRDYIDTVKEQRIMEKHKGLWKKKVALELSRREETEMDELGNIIHQLKKVA